MAACRVYFTHVHLTQTFRVFAEYAVSLRHRSVALPRMPDIKAKHRLGELFEDDIQLFQCPTDRLSTIHIFDGELLPKNSPGGKVVNRIRMKNDGPIPRHGELQAIDDLHFLLGAEAARSMDRFVVVRG